MKKIIITFLTLFFICNCCFALEIENGFYMEEGSLIYYDGTEEILTIPNGIKLILGGAFNRNNVIKEVVIPEGVTEIRETAFADCEQLEKITIPSSVIYIGENAFKNTKWEQNHTEEFVILNNVLYKYNGTSGDVIIPSNVTAISGQAFMDCASISSIIIPNGVTKIGPSAFAGCTGLSQVTIPDSVTSLGEAVFEECTSLKNVELSDNIEFIQENTFSECTSLENVKLPNGLINIASYAFSNCTSLKDIDIPASVENVGEYAFINTKVEKYTTNMVISDGILIKYSGNETKVIIPKGVETISANAFRDAVSVKEIMIPDTVTTIDANAFNGCTSLNQITIPDSVTYIGKGIFENCTSLREIALPDGIQQIREYTFSGCTALKEATIPDSVIVIDENAFQNTPNVTLFVNEDTFAEIYAIENSIKYNNGAIKVVPTLATIIVNGERIEFDAYNINDNNYFKLRDLAYVLNGTEKGFGVKWDANAETMYLTSHTPYEEVGGEMTKKDHDNLRTVKTNAKIYVDDYFTRFKAYNINDNNYFKLRDIGRKFDFGITWDGDTETIKIDTSETYIEEN